MMDIDAPFAVEVVVDGGSPRLALTGRVDRDAEAGLLAAFTDAAGPRPDRVVLDLTHATYINSSGLAAIVALLAEARSRGIDVAARGLTDHYRHLFEITRLTDLVEVEPDTDGGIA